MPYAIPANVKYEEKILGPFTMKQSIFVIAGVGISLYVYLGLEMPLMIKMSIISVVGMGTIGFAMFDLDKKIMDYIFFFRQPKTTSWLNPAAKKLMNIKSIRADTVFLKSNRMLGVLKVRPINFGIMSEQDRDTVIYGFLEFLNSLDFPIQIVMRSVNLDVDDYLRHMKRRILKRDDRVALAYYEHFSDYLNKYIKENRINDRHFYIIVQGEKKGDEKNRLDALRNRCNTIQSNLSLSGIISERMNTHQLINFYSSYFTETFEIHESFISPITMYKKMWKESPKRMDEKRAAAKKTVSTANPTPPQAPQPPGTAPQQPPAQSRGTAPQQPPAQPRGTAPQQPPAQPRGTAPQQPPTTRSQEQTSEKPPK